MTIHKHGGDVYRFKDYLDYSANCNPLGLPSRVSCALEAAIPDMVHYPDVECEKLIAAIAAYEQVPVSMVRCGNGAAEVIFSLCLAKKPHKGLVLSPTFAEYEQALDSVDCQVKYYPLREETGFCLEEDFLSHLETDLDIVFICNPNNPTGVLIQQDFLERILIKCREKQILLVVDECFLDFIDKPEAYTLKGLLAEYENLFLLKAFTKRYAMAGIRLGYGLCSDRELLQKMARVTQPWNVSGLAQAAGVAALQEKEYVRRGRELIFEEKKYLMKELKQLGFQLYGSEANYIFFRGYKNLAEEIRKYQILIRDCSNYYGLENGYYRIAVRTHEENMRLIQALKTIQQEKL